MVRIIKQAKVGTLARAFVLENGLEVQIYRLMPGQFPAYVEGVEVSSVMGIGVTSEMTVESLRGRFEGRSGLVAFVEVLAAEAREAQEAVDAGAAELVRLGAIQARIYGLLGSEAPKGEWP